MFYIFDKFLYEPLLNILILIYQYISFHDFGVAVIILTVLIRLVLAPFLQMNLKQQQIIGRLQPEIKKIQEEYKNDKEKQSRELLALYSKHKINPFYSLLFLVIQIPVLIALYRVLLSGLNGGVDTTSLFYSFVVPPETINYYFLGWINLRERSFVLAGLAAAAQYFQSKLQVSRQVLPTTSKKQEGVPVQKMGQMMVWIGPVLTFIILWSWNLPAAIALYWLVSTLFSLGQQLIIIYHSEYKKCRD